MHVFDFWILIGERHQANRATFFIEETPSPSRAISATERQLASALECYRMLSCIVWRAAFHGNENICRSAGRLRRAREVAGEEGETRQR